MAVLVLVFGFSLLMFVCFALLKWNEIRFHRKGLPPGTMGWPVFGETTEFLKFGPDFMKNQKARYGNVFKSHILGCPTIVSMDPELNRFILLNEGKGLVPGYPQSMLEMLGKFNIGALHGSAHKHIRGSLLSLGRKEIEKILRQIMEERRGSITRNKDMLDQILKDEKSKFSLTDEEIIDQMITILFAGYETVSTTSMMAIKYLHDNPKALQELREEHLAIRRRKGAEDHIDWDDLKSMSFTHCVILETSRLASVVNGVLRKTTANLEMNGFVFPKGWKIYVYTREINYDPFLYPQPFSFDPWRWLDKSLENHKYCFIFGGGSRLCPGKELGIVQISIFLHYFVTRYRWEEVGKNEILKFPRVEARNGLYIKVSKY
ncbi:hypothetical protein FEM48_Zijuj10G0101300 [Ziziphus jujuba var. spinosa]|uniref:Cytochrome P450 85A-like n=1 Tax=Ziziphus jujuba var. spinosa TaxID=714518 RepID=A0A978UMR9_ZIZJJ|nr:hypothetical protein FEM48_Zijuj10G0101300 [Ziziphus jujuba var. spinosa]